MSSAGTGASFKQTIGSVLEALHDSIGVRALQLSRMR